MGILIPISMHVNRNLRAAAERPSWAASEVQRRAMRYATAYTKNAHLLESHHCKGGF